MFKTRSGQHVYQPEIKYLLYWDASVLLLVFLLTLLADFTARSIQFNIVISLFFLAKVLLSARYRLYKSFTTLRNLVTNRLAIDAIVILPVVALYRARSATSSYNILIVFILLSVSELIILIRYAANLFLVNSIEVLEAL